MRGAQPGDLFERSAARDPLVTPLAERMRPRTLDELVGQPHLFGPGRMLRRALEADRIPSMILWGPPGTGKTTIAQVIAHSTGAAFEQLSAVAAGVREIRAIVDAAKERRAYARRGTLLFVDEIHRFNKAQQDVLLPHVEAGVCRLIGATTENPSFEVNAALLSRTRVVILRELSTDDLVTILQRALVDRERGLGARDLLLADDLLRTMARTAEGDARRALTTLEVAADLVPEGSRTIEAEHVSAALGGRSIRYDRAGEEHYNVVSAFIKSMRASDPDAAVYWLARMLEAGEDPMFVARRVVIFASEDVGNTDPQALLVAQAAAQATHLVGMPEAVLVLSQAVQYLALAPKGNTSLTAYAAAQRDVEQHGALPVPLVVRNAVTKLMREAGYGRGYRYPHDEPGSIERTHGSYLPEAIARRPEGAPRYVVPGDGGWQADAWARLEAIRVAQRSAEAAAATPSSPSRPPAPDEADSSSA